jgi:hypothetical protein
VEAHVNQLTIVLSDNERSIIADELTRLFALQDVPLGKEKKAILIEELSIQGLPVEAIKAGLRSLVKEELPKIKLSTLVDAAHRQVTHETEAGEACEHCFGGLVIMRDDKKSEFALDCLCSMGNQRGELAKWNGQDTFYRRGRWLEIVKKVPMSKVPENAA